MANELQNAVTLMGSEDFKSWITAASVYQARLVIMESSTTPDHEARLALAINVISTPNLIVGKLSSIVAADPQVASLGDTPQLIGQTVILQKVSDIWTTLAKLPY